VSRPAVEAAIATAEEAVETARDEVTALDDAWTILAVGEALAAAEWNLREARRRLGAS
jgi:hypothetical protein